jgi:hypothetical protein
VVTRLLVALSCALLLPACSTSSSTTGSPPPVPATSSSEPSTTPTPERETPEEFVRRWVEVDREMQNTGDTAEYRRMTRRCPPCDGVADQVEGIYAAGGYLKTDGLKIRTLRTGSPDANNEVEVRLEARSTPTEYVEKAGGPLKAFPGGLVTYLVTLQPSQASWTITMLERLAQ